VRISSLFGPGRPVFSFEFFPPRTTEGERLLERTLTDLRGLQPDFVSVTYGAGGSTRDRTIDLVSRIKRETGLETMAHLTCVGSSRTELESVLDRFEQAGVENVIALRGDPPAGDHEFRPHPDGLAHASDLVRMIRDRKRPFCVAAACYPETHTEAPSGEADLAHLVEKVRAGVDVLVTQLFFDNEFYFRFVERARAAGINVPIVAGIMPITNLGQIERFTRNRARHRAMPGAAGGRSSGNSLLHAQQVAGDADHPGKSAQAVNAAGRLHDEGFDERDERA
jgi:methylenetetrahydrofolate reductase (NADPH)